MDYKKIVGAALACAVLIGGYFFGVMKSKNQRAYNDTLVMGIAAGYAPYISINERGDYEGFDIDVARAAAQKLNKNLVFKDLGSMTSLMMALDQHSIDAIIWGVSITQQRLQKYAMIHYQGAVTNAYPLIFWGTVPANVRTLADMAGRTVCVEPSSSQSAVLERYTDIIIVPVDKVDDALLNLQYGKADAALLDPVIAKKFIKKFPEIKVLVIPLAPEDQMQGVGIVINKNNTTLSTAMQRAIDELKIDGTLAQLEKNWGLE
jgi:polar amino acid transport system substrate-binding protein